MVDINKLQEEELNALNNEDVFDLESLITDGADARVPVRISFPKYEKDGTMRTVQAGALIRPLTNIEWNNAIKRNRNDYTNKTTDEIELLKKALYNTNEEQMPAEIVELIPAGVVSELVKEVARISGIDIEENLRLAKKMGFSI